MAVGAFLCGSRRVRGACASRLMVVRAGMQCTHPPQPGFAAQNQRPRLRRALSPGGARGGCGGWTRGERRACIGRADTPVRYRLRFLYGIAV